jgi:hypothetical protein
MWHACVACRLSALEEAASSAASERQEEVARQVAALRAELAAHLGSFHADAGSVQGLRSGLDLLRSRAGNLTAAMETAAEDHKMTLERHNKRLTELEKGAVDSNR